MRAPNDLEFFPRLNYRGTRARALDIVHEIDDILAQAQDALGVLGAVLRDDGSEGGNRLAELAQGVELNLRSVRKMSRTREQTVGDILARLTATRTEE